MKILIICYVLIATFSHGYDFDENDVDTHNMSMRHIDERLKDRKKTNRAPFSEYVGRQANVWRVIDSMDSYKNRDIYSKGYVWA